MARNRIAKFWTVVLVALAFLMLALAGQELYSRPLLSLLVQEFHGGSLPARMWIPEGGSRRSRVVKRVRPDFVLADPEAAALSMTSPIDLLGAENFLGRPASAILEFLAALFLSQD